MCPENLPMSRDAENVPVWNKYVVSVRDGQPRKIKAMSKKQLFMLIHACK